MEIIDEIKHVIAKSLKIPVDQLADDTKLADLGAASLDVIEIVFELEEKFNVDIAIRPGKNSPNAGGDGAGDNEQLNGLALMKIGEIARSVQLLVEAKGA